MQESSLALSLRSTSVIVKHFVHLLKRLSCCLGNKEVGPQQRKEAKDGKEDVCAMAGILNQWWCD